MFLTDVLKSVSSYIFVECLCNSNCIPFQWGTSESISEGIATEHYWPNLDSVGLEHIQPDFLTDVKKHIQVALAELRLEVEQLRQLYQPYSEDVVCNSVTEYLENIVEDCSEVEIVIEWL